MPSQDMLEEVAKEYQRLITSRFWSGRIIYQNGFDTVGEVHQFALGGTTGTYPRGFLWMDRENALRGAGCLAMANIAGNVAFAMHSIGVPKDIGKVGFEFNAVVQRRYGSGDYFMMELCYRDGTYVHNGAYRFYDNQQIQYQNSGGTWSLLASGIEIGRDAYVASDRIFVRPWTHWKIIVDFQNNKYNTLNVDSQEWKHSDGIFVNSYTDLVNTLAIQFSLYSALQNKVVRIDDLIITDQEG